MQTMHNGQFVNLSVLLGLLRLKNTLQRNLKSKNSQENFKPKHEKSDEKKNNLFLNRHSQKAKLR